jgi:hypothetical protein
MLPKHPARRFPSIKLASFEKQVSGMALATGCGSPNIPAASSALPLTQNQTVISRTMLSLAWMTPRGWEWRVPFARGKPNWFDPVLFPWHVSQGASCVQVRSEGCELRHLAVHPQRPDPITHLQRIKGANRTAPITAVGKKRQIFRVRK